MARFAPFTVRISCATLPRRTGADALAPLVKSAGGRLLRVVHPRSGGSIAVALGIDPETLRLLASIAPAELDSLN